MKIGEQGRGAGDGGRVVGTVGRWAMGWSKGIEQRTVSAWYGGCDGRMRRREIADFSHFYSAI